MLFHNVLNLEIIITENISKFIKYFLFFLTEELQSTCVTILHYLIFIIGIYYFYFVAKPGSLFKRLFFIFCLLAYISYLTFDKCLCTSIEYCIYKDANIIQQIMNGGFGEGEEGKAVSKSNLLMITIFLGLSLLYDRRIFKK